MIETELKTKIRKAIEKLYPKTGVNDLDIEISKPKNQEGVDYSCNIAFKLARQLKDSPQKIAKTIVSSGFLKKELVVSELNGYINFSLDLDFFYSSLEDILKHKENFADGKKKKDKVQIEFISANPTGPLTLANGRGGFSGDALANVFKKRGYEVEREYYVNDGGNQVKILGDSILVAVGLLKKEEDFYRGEYIEEWVSENKDLIQKLQNDSFKLGQLAAKDLIKDKIKPSVEKMNIKFDNWFSEKEMIDRGEVDEAIEKLKKYKLTEEKDGALWMKTTKFGDDKDRVLIKADGEKTYFANDVAYHFDKLYKRNFTKIIDIWGADHHGYIGRMKAAVEAMGCPGALEVIITQMVRLIKDGKEFKMSKRKGTFVTMDELIDMIGGDRNASDVVRFFFLSRSFNTHMDFDIDLAKDTSEKNPVYYVKYAYARICGILRNSEKIKLSEANLSLLKSKEEINLIKEIVKLPETIEKIINSKDYPVHELTFYSREIASKFHSFYDKCRVIDDENLKLTAARLKLVEATKVVLSIVTQDLIGIDAPEKM